MIRILVVDDYELIRRGVVSLVREHPGWEVAGESSDGAEAVAKATELKPDLVILDVSLPQLNGWVAARLILDAMPECRVLFLSQFEGRFAVKEAMRVGASGYVCKMDAGRELVGAMESALRGTFFASSSCGGIDGALANRQSVSPGFPDKKLAEP